MKVTLRRRTSVTKGTREKMRKRMKGRARRRGYGERQRGYWFKKGVEHPRARKDKIRVIDIETGTSQVLILLEVLKLTGGSRAGVWYLTPVRPGLRINVSRSRHTKYASLENNRVYKGRYVLKRVEGDPSVTGVQDSKKKR